MGWRAMAAPRLFKKVDQMAANMQKSERILVAAPPPPDIPVAAATVEVARKHGVSPLRQLREFTSLYLGPTKLASNEYYAAQVYRDDLDKQAKRQFVGEKSNLSLNKRLSPPEIARRSDFLRDKVLVSALLRQLGLNAPVCQAVFSQARGFGTLRTLRNAEQIAEFLKAEADFPIFGKPVSGSKSVGSALLKSFDPETSIVTLGNGRTANVYKLAEEIVRDYPRGFVFQDAVIQDEEVSEVIGTALGCLRVVTTMEDNTPKVLYSVWKIPAPTAMSDNFWQSGSMLGDVDIETGCVRQVRRGTGLKTENIEVHPESGKALVGFQFPGWPEVTELAKSAHAISPENGVLGWDIGLSENGPVIIECNSNPFHTLYQLATGRGILNEEFKPVFDRIIEHNEKLLALNSKR